MERIHQFKLEKIDLKSMVQIASSSNGFSCGLALVKGSPVTAYHDKATLFSFKKESYKKGNIDYANNEDDVPFAFSSWQQNSRRLLRSNGLGQTIARLGSSVLWRNVCRVNCEYFQAAHVGLRDYGEDAGERRQHPRRTLCRTVLGCVTCQSLGAISD